MAESGYKLRSAPKPVLLNISTYCQGEILYDRGDAQILFFSLQDKVKRTLKERTGRSEEEMEAEGSG